MSKNDPNERMRSKEVFGKEELGRVFRSHSIKDQLTGKEKELLELCGSDSRLDLTGKIKELIQFGIKLNAKDKNGMNALHLLCRYYSNEKLIDAIKLVIESGIDVNARDNNGMNAIHYLCRYHSSKNLIDAIQILNKSGIDVKAKTNDGSNALHYLCRDNSNPNVLDAVNILIEVGVDVQTKDKDGWNALYYLYNKDKKEMKIWINRDTSPIGKGGFGMVFKGNFGGREVAVKRVLIDRVDKREEEAMLKLYHPNIVKLLHCEKDNDFMYYALELCVASLDQLFLKEDVSKKYNGRMPPPIKIFRQLATGLAYIHSQKLIHRDIKPENILISCKPGKCEEIIMKLSDFGLAKCVNEKGLHSWTGVRGTRTWYAPEVLEKLINGKKAENAEKADEFWGTVKSDVFVLGLVFGYFFLKGEHLFGSSEEEIHKNIIRHDPVNMKNIDDELRKYYEDDLLNKMLEHDPDKRISSKEVVEQLEPITKKLTEKEKELLELCGRDSRSDLTEKIKELIQFGINVKAKDKDGMNALHLLCRYYSNPKLIDAIQLLIRNGIDVNARDNDGMNAIHYLCWYHSSQKLIDAFQILNQSGIDAKAITNDGSNALHYLCRYNSTPNLVDAVGILTKLGVDMMLPDNAGWNAFYYSQNKFNKEMKIWFDRQQPIGEGGFGMVNKGKFGGREVAVKRVEMRHVDKREEDAMLKLDHPNIVKLLHYETDNDFMQDIFFMTLNNKMIPKLICFFRSRVKEIDGELRKYYENDLLTKMLEYDTEKRMNSTEVVNQLASIKNKLTEKETEFRQLFAGYTSADLVGRINDLIRLGIDVNAKGKYGINKHRCIGQTNVTEQSFVLQRIDY
ncbi:RGS domain-containing serine/threonine-protein kinase A-like [Daphnia carinata]|uniref:RGS domain-containing serine/threonine-protein kinase A-like n=1 Tax=Daphnia carinata TaxID=120202 RepID=UPI002869602C|nr:RGS domain-containing serine/threonine-protein kinase A-like [Daphnia carinata]